MGKDLHAALDRALDIAAVETPRRIRTSSRHCAAKGRREGKESGIPRSRTCQSKVPALAYATARVHARDAALKTYRSPFECPSRCPPIFRQIGWSHTHGASPAHRTVRRCSQIRDAAGATLLAALHASAPLLCASHSRARQSPARGRTSTRLRRTTHRVVGIEQVRS